MSDFIKLMTNQGSKLGNANLNSSDMSKDISKAGKELLTKNVLNPISKTSDEFGGKIAEKFFGYKTEEEEKQDEEREEKLKKGLREVRRLARKKIKKWKKDNIEEYINMTNDERKKKMSELYEEGFKETYEANYDFKNAIDEENQIRKEENRDLINIDKLSSYNITTRRRSAKEKIIDKEMNLDEDLIKETLENKKKQEIKNREEYLGRKLTTDERNEINTEYRERKKKILHFEKIKNKDYNIEKDTAEKLKFNTEPCLKSNEQKIANDNIADKFKNHKSKYTNERII